MSNINNVSFILGIVYILNFSWWFKSLRSLRKITLFVLCLGCAKYWSPHSESFEFLNTTCIIRLYTSFLNISYFTFGTIHGIENIEYSISFDYNYIGSIFQVPSVTLKNYSNFCNNLSNLSSFSSIKCWHWFLVTLFKSTFSYLASKITRNFLYKYWIFLLHIISLRNNS